MLAHCLGSQAEPVRLLRKDALERCRQRSSRENSTKDTLLARIRGQHVLQRLLAGPVGADGFGRINSVATPFPTHFFSEEDQVCRVQVKHRYRSGTERQSQKIKWIDTTSMLGGEPEPDYQHQELASDKHR